MPTLNEIRDEAHDRYNENPDLDHVCTRMSGECGEICNKVGKLTRAKYNPNFYKINKMGESELVKEIKGEIPDLLFYIGVLAKMLGINLDRSWIDKMEYNTKKYDYKPKK